MLTDLLHRRFKAKDLNKNGLPRIPIVGDRVRIKADLRPEFRKIYGEQASIVHTVEAELDRKVYGEEMLRLKRVGDGPQIIIRPRQVEFAWDNDQERRAGLEAAYGVGPKVSYMHGRRPDGSAA